MKLKTKRAKSPWLYFSFEDKLGEEEFENLTKGNFLMDWAIKTLDEKIFKVTDFINEKILVKYFFKGYKYKCKINNWDMWHGPISISIHAYEFLKLLKENKLGVPYIDNCDVPQELHEEDGDIDKLGLKWNYVLEEMMFAHKYVIDSFDDVEEGEGYDRCKNGLALFSKYYLNLWT